MPTITPQALPDPYLAAGGVQLTWVDLGSEDGVFTLTGREILLVRDSTGTGLTATVTSTPDPLGRTRDIDIVISSGTLTQFLFGPIPLDGFGDGSNQVTVQFVANLEAAVIQLPV